MTKTGRRIAGPQRQMSQSVDEDGRAVCILG